MLESFLGVVNQVWSDGLYGIGITELIVSIVILLRGLLFVVSLLRVFLNGSKSFPIKQNLKPMMLS